MVSIPQNCDTTDPDSVSYSRTLLQPKDHIIFAFCRTDCTQAFYNYIPTSLPSVILKLPAVIGLRTIDALVRSLTCNSDNRRRMAGRQQSMLANGSSN
jgi:hypothetical protein